MKSAIPSRFSPWNSAWVLLALVNLFWAGNIVLGRGLAGHVPPITLAFGRWGGAFLIAFGFALAPLRRDWPVLLAHWKLMLVLAFTGIAIYNTFSYIGLNGTTALNVLLLQSAMPLIIIVWAFLLFGERPSLRQSAGVTLSLAGVLAIAAHGSMAALTSLEVNRGDLWIIAAMVIYGPYSVLIRRRPATHPLSFLVVAMGIGACMILPFAIWELAQGARIEASAAAWSGIAYTAVFPSFLAYLFFNRGVELAGSALAGQSMHLMPVFGSVLAVLFLGESFRLYHLFGIALIGAGILLATTGRPAASLHPTRT